MRALLVLSAILVLSLFPFARALPQSIPVEEEIRAGDEALDRRDPARALSAYREALRRLEATAPGSVLLSDVVNNIAAVNMTEGKTGDFAGTFALAKSLKQALAPGPVDTGLRERPPVNGGFEDGLVFPWGTGHYERAEGAFGFGVWWNSMNARAYMKIDTAEKHSGKRSLRITNFSPAAPHVFTTLSQRIPDLKPNTVYRISYFAKARDLAPGAACFAMDAAWGKRLPALPPGTYDWTPFSSDVNIGHNDFIDLRIIHQSTGTLWLDDIVVEEAAAGGETDFLQRVESLIDTAEFEQALELCLRLEATNAGNAGTLGRVRLYLGRIYQATGKYDKALDAFTRAAAGGLRRANLDLARLYVQLGDYGTAGEYFRKSLEAVKGDQGTESLVLHDMSRCSLAAGRQEEALGYQKTSHRILEHIGDRHGLALSLNQLGEISFALRDFRNAREQFKEALLLARQLRDRKLESDALLNLAEVTYSDGKFKESSKTLRSAQEIKRAIGDSLGLVRVLHLRARHAVRAEQLRDAREFYREAIALLEEMSASVADISRETRATFMNQFNALYREYVELLVRLSPDGREPSFRDEAFQVVEQARSRIFTEMVEESLALSAFAANGAPGFGNLLEEERLLTVKMHALSGQLRKAGTGGDPQDAKALAARLEELNNQRRNVRERLLKEFPRYADLKKPAPLDLREVQRLLTPEEALLSIFVTPGRTLLWAVTREGSAFAAVPLSREELIARTEKFRLGFLEIARSLGLPGAASPGSPLRTALSSYPLDEAHALYRTLVSPVEDRLRSKKLLYLVLDDLLYRMPFETLLTGEYRAPSTGGGTVGAHLAKAPFLVDRYSISYLPSISVLRSLRSFPKIRAKSQKPLLAFADPLLTLPEGGTTTKRGALLRGLLVTPDTSESPTLPPLPDTREEALHVARVLGASPDQDVYLRERATEYNVKHVRLNEYRNLLFATHGLLAGAFGPGTQPALALSAVNDPENDGLLEMSEILGLDLNADLAVLSACNTADGSGKADRGEGFAGLTRSFMYAGARSLLVTEWSVESGSARMLVEDIFSQMRKGRSKVEALALAKRRMIAGGKEVLLAPGLRVSLAHPYFWAPYILVGEMHGEP